ncbi:sigma-70 family RNA polymerase sigma factor [Planctomycetales bacterium ZRK34]|nr:sigma-70 family RNA polymerase sigma factor [Planctomycetales bacterium ZRK34]
MDDSKRMQQLAMAWTKAQPAVAAFISSMVGDFHQTEDLLQKTAAAVVVKYDTYDAQRSFTAWAIGVARHEVLAHRRASARDRHVFDEHIIATVADAFAAIESEFDPMKQALAHCMQHVTGRSRRLLELRYAGDLDLPQIADRLQMKPNAVYVALHRARHMLRECIRQQLNKPDHP